MRIVISLVALLFFLMNNQAAFSEDVRHRSFSKQEIDEMDNTRAIIRTEYGDIAIRFLPGLAPNHVDNFISLSGKAFYNGTVFHRVIPGFMIQGGDPNSRGEDRSRHGTGGPGYFLKAEFSKRPHKRGTVSMARSRHPDSAGSQFFICVADAPHLNGQYTVFGEVVSGMDIVDKIVNEPRDRRDNPIKRNEISVSIIREVKED